MKILGLLILLASTSDDAAVDQTVISARAVMVGSTSDMRVADTVLIAPGQPPLLSFRTYEGKLRQRFANSDLMLDDAGH